MEVKGAQETNTASAIDRAQILDFESTDEQLLAALNSVMKVITSEQYNIAKEKIHFIADVKLSREQIKLTNRLVNATVVLAVFTAILAVATIALVFATMALVQAGG